MESTGWGCRLAMFPGIPLGFSVCSMGHAVSIEFIPFLRMLFRAGMRHVVPIQTVHFQLNFNTVPDTFYLQCMDDGQ